MARHLSYRADFRPSLANLHRLPVEIIAGWKDINTPPDIGLIASEALIQSHGNEQVRMIAVNRDHNLTVPDVRWEDTRAWLLSHEPAAAWPQHIILQPINLRFRSQRLAQHITTNSLRPTGKGRSAN